MTAHFLKKWYYLILNFFSFQILHNLTVEWNKLIPGTLSCNEPGFRWISHVRRSQYNYASSYYCNHRNVPEGTHPLI